MAESKGQSATVADRRYNNWLHRFVWLTAVATLLLICSGGMVTSKGVGLAVPDWPTTFGYNVFLFPVSRWVGGIFFEHTHRLVASTVGLLTIVLAVWLWRAEPRRWVRVLGYTALAAVIVQGVLGGLRVTMLRDEIGVFHACLAQAFLGLLVFIAVVTSRAWDGFVPSRHGSPVLTLALAITGLIYLQLALGATMRHQHRDLSILDFPTAYGKFIPEVNDATLAQINAWRDAHALSNVTAFQIWLQMAHRFVAMTIAGAVIAFWSIVQGRPGQDAIVRRLSTLWMFFLACQLALGGWTIWSNKAADVATAHVAAGATMLGFGVAISAICWRSGAGISANPARAPALMTEGTSAI